MAPIPITLVGDSLDERHKYLNSLTNETINNGEEFDLIKNLPEKSHIDRLYKIDLAVKLHNLDYIIKNLQDDDMLFVSKALNSTWLIEKQYEDIINPQYLEVHLYPNMITTAVNKMQHWIHLKMSDISRCKLFYDYYFEKNFNLAIHFLVKCSKEDIENEFSKVMYKITPHYLKVLSEKSSKVVKTFFDLIPSDPKIKRQFLENIKPYVYVTRHLLKTDGEMVLDIAEKYLDTNAYQIKYSRQHTKIIMKHHKQRFWVKPELYTRWFLHTQALADCLSSEEAKLLVLKLAQASYISDWFSYQNVEPFIKRLKPDERVAYKKKIFVEKDVGDVIEEWPYDIPTMPTNDIEYATIFDDIQPEPSEYKCLVDPPKRAKRPIRKKKGNIHDITEIYCENEKTLLDKLFDEFRFESFGKTLYELRKRLSAESSPQNREYILLVLVSKSGGKPDAIAALLELLALHVNETPNFRAAIIRSFVKRSHVWRLPEESWNKLIQFGQGLGLDGKTPDADCFEGLHALVIRSLLLTGECESQVKNAFVFKHFSTFKDYPLDIQEKAKIATVLPKMLHDLVYEKEFVHELGCPTSAYCIEKLIKTLRDYKINLETYPGLIETLVKFAAKDTSDIDYILDDLYRARVARKQLFKYMFPLVRTDESFLNALRHDISVLDANKFADMYGMFILRADRFIKKMSLYFSEENGLASKFLQELQAKPHDKINGKPIALLLNDHLVPYLDNLDALNGLKTKLQASAIRANAHFARPAIDLDTYGWKKIGAKQVACKLMKCRSVDVDKNIEKLLQWKRTSRIACALSKRTSYQTEIFMKLAAIRSTIGLKTGLRLLKLQGENADMKIWETIKPIIQELDVTKPSRVQINNRLGDIDKTPIKIRAEYATIVYTAFLKISLYHAMPPLCHVEILLPRVEEQFVESLVRKFLVNDFTIEKLEEDNKQMLCTCMFVRILVKYILLSKSEEEQKRKIEAYFIPFLAKLDELRSDTKKKILFAKYFPEMLRTLKYSEVFLNIEYVSPLPIIETIIAWMRKTFAMEEHFLDFAQLHLLILFYKAVKQALELAPDAFSDKFRKITKGVEIFGKIFGKYLAGEVVNLQKEYFETAPELYSKSVINFLDRYNYYYQSSDLMTSLIKGIFGERTVLAYRLGIYLLNEKFNLIRDEQAKDLIDFVHKIDCPESQWLVSILER